MGLAVKYLFICASVLILKIFIVNSKPIILSTERCKIQKGELKLFILKAAAINSAMHQRSLVAQVAQKQA